MAHGPQIQQGNRGNYALAVEIMIVINKTDYGCMRLEEIQVFFPSVRMNRIWKAIINNPRCFVTDGQSEPLSQMNKKNIYVKAPMGLCSSYISKNSECDGDCGELHMCRSYLLGSANACRFRTQCKFGHSFETRHNRHCLYERGLGNFPNQDLKRLFRRYVSRTPATTPEICFFYNSEKENSCSNKKCSALHICYRFIIGECSGRCEKNHEFNSGLVRKVLLLYGMDDNVEWSETTLKEFFKNVEMSKPEKVASSRQSGRPLPSQGKLVVTESSDEDESEEGEESVEDDKCSGCKALYRTVLQNKSQILHNQSQINALQDQIRTMQERINEIAQHSGYNL